MNFTRFPSFSWIMEQSQEIILSKKVSLTPFDLINFKFKLLVYKFWGLVGVTFFTPRKKFWNNRI
jgi:hypothetical protein